MILNLPWNAAMETRDHSNGRGFGKLPLEILERVLSSLPVPDLCRCRSVCKTWNELVGKSSFHDLCDLNTRSEKDVYMFMWRELRFNSRDVIDPLYTRTLGFLHLDARRWYSIQTADQFPGIETRCIAMHDGLVCELTTLRGMEDDIAVAISDPVAKTRRMLPAPPEIFSTGDALPRILTVVDDVTRNYKVFLLNNLSQTRTRRALPRMYVYDSCTNEWLGLENPPLARGETRWAMSAVILHQTLYVVRMHYVKDYWDQLSLLRYNIHENTWTEVWRMSFSRSIWGPELVARGNRLFVSLWSERYDLARQGPPPSRGERPNSLSQSYQDYPDEMLEMYEILITDNYVTKPVAQVTYDQLPDYVQCGYPCFDSNGVCNSVVFIFHSTGKLIMYELATGSVDVLPPHPLLQTSYDWEWNIYYHAINMKLSLRNLLGHSRVTGGGVENLPNEVATSQS